MITIFVIIILALYYHFEPEKDVLKNGDWIIWYNSNGRRGNERKYFKLW